MTARAVSISISIPHHYLEVINHHREQKTRSEWIFEAICKKIDDEEKERKI